MAILASFAAAHLNAPLFLNYFVFGCMMSVLLEATKSIYTVGFIHFLYNVFATL
jgi:membrane protease YdiL (CAAX protease family)